MTATTHYSLFILRYTSRLVLGWQYRMRRAYTSLLAQAQQAICAVTANNQMTLNEMEFLLHTKSLSLSLCLSLSGALSFTLFHFIDD